MRTMLLHVDLGDSSVTKPSDPHIASTTSRKPPTQVLTTDATPKSCEIDDDDATASTVDSQTTCPSCTVPPRPVAPRPLILDTLPSTGLRPSLRKIPLRTAIRSPTAKSLATPSSERRVRGLWKNSSLVSDTEEFDPFERLQDHTLETIFSFLNVRDRLTAGQASRRFHYISQQERGWKNVCVTDLSSKVVTSPSETSETLSSLFQKHPSIESLSLCQVGGSLCPEKLILPKKLVSLVIEGYSTLSDTAFHVLLLSLSTNVEESSLVRSKSNKLRSLKLLNCERLTSKTLKSIAVQCPQLEELVITGCGCIETISPLRTLLMTGPERKNPLVSPSSTTQRKAKAHLSGLFDPPKKTPSTAVQPVCLENMFAPLATPPPQPPRHTTSLSSLFAPPGHSPRRTPSHTVKSGRLTRLTTCAAPEQILDALHHTVSTPRTPYVYIFDRLSATSTLPWTREQLLQLSNLCEISKPNSLLLNVESMVLNSLPQTIVDAIVPM